MIKELSDYISEDGKVIPVKGDLWLIFVMRLFVRPDPIGFKFRLISKGSS